jgi:two-component SAPR family response regulator
LLGGYEKSLIDIDQFINITEQDEELRSLYAEALRSKALILFRLGQANQAINLFEKSLQLFELLNKKRDIPVLLLELGMTYRAIADFEKAKKTYEKALQMWKQEGDLFQQATLLNNFGVFHHFLGQYEESVRNFEEGLLCAGSIRFIRGDALISIGLGDVYTELEDFDMAIQNYQHAEELISKMDDRFLLHAIALSQANSSFLQKDISKTHYFIEEIKDSILAGKSNYEIGILNLICGKISLLEKKNSESIEHLKSAEKHFTDLGRSVEADIARVWLAAALNQNKESMEATKLINSLNTIRGKFFHSIVVAAYQARDWLQGLPNKSTNNRMVRELIVGAEKLAKELPSIRRQVKRHASVIQPSTSKLKIQAFGNAMVYLDSKPSTWQTQAVRELFFYFLRMHKSLTKEQIGELLWPDKYEPSKLNLRFKNEMYRLRKVVGQNAIRYENDLYGFNHDIDYEYDVEDFEAFIAKAKSTQDTKQKISFYQRAIDLVQGPYLNDIYSDWVIEERGRLEQIYLKTLHELADLYLKDGQLESAINICEKALQIDPGEEKAYEIAMKTYYKLGQRGSIIHMYQRYKEVMQTQYGLQPSKEMEDLYQKLTK